MGELPIRNGHDVVLRHRGLHRCCWVGSAPRYLEALDGHRRILRAAWAAHGGTEMGTEGDSFFVVFPTAGAAVSAAAQAQRGLQQRSWPGGERRAGAHRHPHRLAAAARRRLLAGWTSTAPPGSPGPPTAVRWWSRRSPRSWSRPDLPHDVGLRRPRLAPPQGHPGARAPLPAGDGRAAGTTSRPCGRSARPRACRTRPPRWSDARQEVEELTALLRSPGVRLVTLTGPGGSGKTRLAIAVAERLGDAGSPTASSSCRSPRSRTAEVMWTSMAEVAGRRRRATRAERPPRRRRPTLRSCSCSTTSSSSSGADDVVAQLLDAAPRAWPSSRRRANRWDSPRSVGMPCAPLALPEDVTLGSAARLQRRCSSSCSGPAACSPHFRLTPENVARRGRDLPPPGRAAAGHRAVCRPDPGARARRRSCGGSTRPSTSRRPAGWSRRGSGRCATPSPGPTSCSPRRSGVLPSA